MERPIESRPFLTPGMIDMTGATEKPDVELFGPILQVYRCDTFEAAIAEANDTRYGLSASRWSARIRGSTTSSGPISAPASSTGTARPTALPRRRRSAAWAGRAIIAPAPIMPPIIAPIRWSVRIRAGARRDRAGAARRLSRIFLSFPSC
jgi:hypothetical protein